MNLKYTHIHPPQHNMKKTRLKSLIIHLVKTNAKEKIWKIGELEGTYYLQRKEDKDDSRFLFC